MENQLSDLTIRLNKLCDLEVALESADTITSTIALEASALLPDSNILSTFYSTSELGDTRTLALEEIGTGLMLLIGAAIAAVIAAIIKVINWFNGGDKKTEKDKTKAARKIVVINNRSMAADTLIRGLNSISDTRLNNFFNKLQTYAAHPKQVIEGLSIADGEDIIKCWERFTPGQLVVLEGGKYTVLFRALAAELLTIRPGEVVGRFNTKLADWNRKHGLEAAALDKRFLVNGTSMPNNDKHSLLNAFRDKITDEYNSEFREELLAFTGITQIVTSIVSERTNFGSTKSYSEVANNKVVTLFEKLNRSAINTKLTDLYASQQNIVVLLDNAVAILQNTNNKGFAANEAHDARRLLGKFYTDKLSLLSRSTNLLVAAFRECDEFENFLSGAYRNLLNLTDKLIRTSGELAGHDSLTDVPYKTIRRTIIDTHNALNSK
jgi:hypothetical protein